MTNSIQSKKMEHPKEYYAFISYKREDEKWAKWRQYKLEHYKFPLEGHTRNINSAAFSPDGKFIVSAANDGTIRIWDFPPLQELIDQTRKRFKDRQLTPEEKRKYYLE